MNDDYMDFMMYDKSDGGDVCKNPVRGCLTVVLACFAIIVVAYLLIDMFK